MDMQVNTDAFSSASSSLKKHCKIIEGMTGMFLKKLDNIKQDFNDINYDRTVASATSVKKQIVIFSREIDALERDLKTLESLVYEYTNGGYGR